MAPRAFTAAATGSELTDILASDIKGKVILTTGVSPKGLGATFVKAIAKASPALLILAGRNTAKLQQTADEIASAHPSVPTRLLSLQLDSLAEVRKSATTLLEWADVPFIDVLVNNAAIMATPFSLTVDGNESQFATNHLGHFLFTNLILPKLLASPTGSPRIVNVASDGHRFSPIRWGDINFNRTGDASSAPAYHKWRAYGQSKTANMLYTLSLAQKLGPSKGLLAYSLHPGVIATNLDNAITDWEADGVALKEADLVLGNVEAFEEFKWKSPDEGIATHVFAAFEPSLKEVNGAYLLDAHVGDARTESIYPWATSTIEAEKLWKLSEELVGQKFEF